MLEQLLLLLLSALPALGLCAAIGIGVTLENSVSILSWICMILLHVVSKEIVPSEVPVSSSIDFIEEEERRRRGFSK